MLGIHVFEKHKEDKFDDILYSSTLLSVLSWKKFHGPIHLYTNTFFAEELKKRGIDKYYDRIDTEFIENRRDQIDTKIYWAWNKIRVAAKLEPPFVLLDTDLWLSSKLDFPEDKTFVAYHSVLLEKEMEDYPDIDSVLPKDLIGRWKKWIMPLNTALLFIQNKDQFFTNWMNTVKLIAESDSKNPEDSSNSYAKMIFVEERLLPMLADEFSIPYQTFISQIYNTSRIHFNDGTEWIPPVWAWDDELRLKFTKIHHIWGLKDYYENFEIREYLIKSMLSHLSEYEEIKNHEELISNLIYLMETEELNDHKIKN